MVNEGIAASEQALEGLMRQLFTLSKDHHLRDMAEMKLSNAQGMCLMVIGSTAPVTMGRIADYMALSSAAATSLVDRLVQSGWVSRQADDRDRRIVQVNLTSDGTAIYDELRQRRCGRMREAMATLTEPEQATLLEGMSLFVKALSGGRS
ncbi:MAG: MarR family transcriptional regulator [Candidatus Sericytochromatia bacterium]|nr:MarR family transcriptional regulator [Candidatus Sericytochromatia bacterium]